MIVSESTVWFVYVSGFFSFLHNASLDEKSFSVIIQMESSEVRFCRTVCHDAEGGFNSLFCQ